MSEREEVSPELVQQFSDAFDAECMARHEMGREKYGPVKFLTVNAFDEAMAELVDVSNYTRYTYIKMAIMRHLDQLNRAPVEVDNSQDTDSSSFISQSAVVRKTGFFNPYDKEA